MKWAGEAWESMQADAPPSARLTKEEQVRLDPLLAACWASLQNTLGALKYTPSTKILDLIPYLETAAPEAPDDWSPADVLNVAWMVRLGGWYEGRGVADGLDDRACLLMRQSIARKGDA